jgi:tetratricopeptide (TPR) repeat protein
MQQPLHRIGPKLDRMIRFARRSFAVRAGYALLVAALSIASVFTFLPRIHAHSDETQTQQKLTDQELARKRYAEMVAKSYNFAFGPNNISTPGNAAVEGNTFLQPSAFPTAEYCGHCHNEAYHQWRQSLHSNSFRTPFYRTSVNILMRTKGIEFARHCDSCHNPVAVLGGGLTQSSVVDRGFDQDGLTCMTCHSVQKLQSTNGNGGYVMGVPAVMVDEKGTRIPGLVPDAEILAHLDRHSKAVMQTIYRTPEFCSACHKANLPNPLNDYKFIRAFTAYDEWQNSKFSKRNPLTFYQADFTTCQGCHMKRSVAGLPEPGAKNGTFASHRWAAGNTAVPFYYGFDEQLAKTIEFLKSGNYLNVDLFAIRRANDDPLIAPLGSTDFNLKAGETIQVMAVVQNKNIGHSLIPEVRDLYEGWVEFVATDSSGKEIYHSGFIKPDGKLDERAHSFTNRPVNTEGTFVDNHKVWTIHSVAYDNTIQAGRSTLIRYEFQIPASAKGPISITARVNYRHLRQSYLNNIFGEDHPAYPIVELASRTRVLNLGDNAPGAPDPKDNPDWMRWNNLGIAYLDQLQYSEAIDAFSHVVKLRPDYADGYTNIGLTNIEWEKYASARGGLEKALELAPENARALYYLALVERRAGHSDAEVEDLQKVLEQYPQSRDARRELGISYYQQRRPQEAMEQFEALQAIDPDDLTAHYNLALLYRRMGMKDKAKEQSAMFVTKKVDPGAPTYSLDFLRKHPEISIESVPWHVHTDAPHAETGGAVATIAKAR